MAIVWIEFFDASQDKQIVGLLAVHSDYTFFVLSISKAEVVLALAKLDGPPKSFNQFLVVLLLALRGRGKGGTNIAAGERHRAGTLLSASRTPHACESQECCLARAGGGN